MADKFIKSLNFGGEDNYFPLPIVTAEQSGMVLKVVDGEWKATQLVMDWSKITWADGTDDQIVAMVAAADAGKINLSDYWSVGDTRIVNLSAMDHTLERDENGQIINSNIGVSDSHDAQTVEFTLMHVGGYELNTITESGRTTCSFVVGMKNCLNTMGCMDRSGKNIGSWNNSGRRDWCNNVFYNAVPNTLRDIFKQFKVITAETYNGTNLQTSVDWFTLPAEREIYGAGYGYDGDGWANNTEANSGNLFQYDWYKTVSNRIKTANGSAAYWWERSPSGRGNSYYCGVREDGTDYYGTATLARGLAPVGCI